MEAPNKAPVSRAYPAAGSMASNIKKSGRTYSTNTLGNVAPLFAASAAVMVALVGAALDMKGAYNVKLGIQAATDSAALAGVTSPTQTTAAIQSAATSVFTANIQQLHLATPPTPTVSVTISSTGTTVQVTTSSSVPTSFLSMAGINSVPVAASSTATTTQGNQQLEVGMMIDLTGSMGQVVNGTSKISGLKTAATSILGILYPNGANTNVKVGIAAMADYVNAGSYASVATGLSQTGPYAPGTDLGQTKQSAYYGYYSGVVGNAAGQGYGATSTGGTNTSSYCSNPNMQQNGYPVGQSVDIYYQWQSAQLGYFYPINNHNQISYYLYWGWYLPVANPGCSTSTQNTGQLISCVTERIGTHAYDDASPTTAPVGAFNQANSSVSNYSSDGKCYVAGRELPAVIPLTNNVTTLNNFFQNATVGGGTPGHLGHMWAWYLISPNWASVWPTGSQPQPYGTPNLRKVAILMTDGEYNEQYSKIDSRTQALATCAAMKSAGIEVFTVGFGFNPSASPSGSDTDSMAENLLSTCASDSKHYYFPYDAAALQAAFQNIGNSLMTSTKTVRLSN